MSDLDITHEIIHYLSMLETSISDEKILKYKHLLIDFTKNSLSNGLNIIKNDVVDVIENIIIPNNIEEVDDEIIRLCYIRNSIVKKKLNYAVCDKRKFLFDNVYNQSNDNELIIEIHKFLNQRLQYGKNSAIIEYGYSNSGKSFLSLEILNLFKNMMKFHLCEIYNNNLYVYDHASDSKIKIMDLKKYNRDNFIIDCDLQNFITILNKFKTTKTTNHNTNSSRSHVIITLFILNKSTDISYTTITIFDLAGCERLNLSKNDDKEQIKIIEKEGKYINSSLYDISQFLIHKKKYKNNKSLLLSYIQKINNIILIIMCNDISDKITSYNHLKAFDKLLK